MKIALANGALGEKMMIDSIFNCLVNDQGKQKLGLSMSVVLIDIRQFLQYLKYKSPTNNLQQTISSAANY